MRLTVLKKIFIVGFIPFIAFGVLAWMSVTESYQALGHADYLKAKLELMKVASQLVSQVQKERGMSASHLNGGATAKAVSAQRAETEKFKSLYEESAARTPIDSDFKARVLSSLNELSELRRMVDERAKAADVVPLYTKVVRSLLSVYEQIVKENRVPGLSRYVQSVALLEESKENAGKLRATVSAILAQDLPISKNKRLTLLSLKAGVESNLQSVALNISEASTIKIGGFAKQPHWQKVDQVFDDIMTGSEDGSYGHESEEFFATISIAVNDIAALIKNEADLVIKGADEVSADSETALTLTSTVIVAVAGVLIFIILLIGRRIANPIVEASGVMKAISAGDLDRSVQARGDDEVAQMVSAMNDTVRSIQEAFEAKKVDWGKVSEMKRLEKEARDTAEREKREAQEAKANAETALKDAEREKQRAEEALESASQQREKAETASREAVEAKSKAEIAAQEAESEKQRAQDALQQSDVQRERAQHALEQSEVEKKRAEEATHEARRAASAAETEKENANQATEKATAASREAATAKAKAEELGERSRREAEELKKKVGVLLEVVSQAESGDLTQDITVKGRDAVGQIGTGLENFFSVLRESINGIIDQANLLMTSNAKLDDLTKDMESNSKETATRSASVAAAAEQLNSNMANVGVNAEEMSASIAEVARSTQSAAQVTRESVSVSAEGKNSIGKLQSRVAEINEFVKLISSIASQTNLLALNATIESARAGDAGRGFAVVANEVKELAKQTATATTQISEKVSVITKDADEAVKAIDIISTYINRINESATSTATAVEEQNATSQEIGRIVKDSTQATSQIAENIAMVNEAAQSTLSKVEATSSAADGLKKVSDKLVSLMSKFKTDRDDSKKDGLRLVA